MPDPIPPPLPPAAATGEGGYPAEQSEADPGPTVTSLLLGAPCGAGHGSRRNHRLTPAGQVVLQGHCGLLKDQPLLHHLNLPHLQGRITQRLCKTRGEGPREPPARSPRPPPASPAGIFPRKSRSAESGGGRHCGPNNSRTLASALLVAFPSKQAPPPGLSAWPEPPRHSREGERHFRVLCGACGVLIPGAPAKVRGWGRGGEMVVWKEVGAALSRGEAGRGRAAVRCPSLELKACRTGDTMTVGGVGESDT